MVRRDKRKYWRRLGRDLAKDLNRGSLSLSWGVLSGGSLSLN